MPVNAAATAYPLSTLPFKASLESIKYLGVCVTRNYSDLFKCNFTPLLTRLTQDFQRWSLVPLSLAGRINCVKINVLPKFLYIFFNVFRFSSQSISSIHSTVQAPRIQPEQKQPEFELFVLLLGCERSVYFALVLSQ